MPTKNTDIMRAWPKRSASHPAAGAPRPIIAAPMVQSVMISA